MIPIFSHLSCGLSFTELNIRFKLVPSLYLSKLVPSLYLSKLVPSLYLSKLVPSLYLSKNEEFSYFFSKFLKLSLRHKSASPC